MKVLIAQLRSTLCDPMDSRPPGFSTHGIQDLCHAVNVFLALSLTLSRGPGAAAFLLAFFEVRNCSSMKPSHFFQGHLANKDIISVVSISPHPTLPLFPVLRLHM